MDAQRSDWISAPEAGRMLQRHPQTVKAWVERGYLVGYQPYPGAHHLISLASVERMLDARQKALARLEHKAAEATSDPRDETKMVANSDEEAETGIAVGDEAHKHIAAFWLGTTVLTAMTAVYADDAYGRGKSS